MGGGGGGFVAGPEEYDVDGKAGWSVGVYDMLLAVKVDDASRQVYKSAIGGAGDDDLVSIR